MRTLKESILDKNFDVEDYDTNFPHARDLVKVLDKMKVTMKVESPGSGYDMHLYLDDDSGRWWKNISKCLEKIVKEWPDNESDIKIGFSQVVGYRDNTQRIYIADTSIKFHNKIYEISRFSGEGANTQIAVREIDNLWRVISVKEWKYAPKGILDMLKLYLKRK